MSWSKKINLNFGITLLILGAFLVFNIPVALSHYLWTTVENNSGKYGITNLYFEESPGPGTGEDLQPFVKGTQTWIRTLKADRPDRIPLVEIEKQGNKWLSGELSQLGPRSVESYAKWGVYRFPNSEIDTLLHYYSKHLDVNSSKSLQALSRANDLLLDIVPGRYVKPSIFFNLDVGVKKLSNFINRWTGPSVEILVRWKGQPVVERALTIRFPTGSKTKIMTDQRGYVRFQAPVPGLYSFKVYIEENDQKGVDQGKPYDVVRYTSTLTMNLPIDYSKVKQ